MEAPLIKYDSVKQCAIDLNDLFAQAHIEGRKVSEDEIRKLFNRHFSTNQDNDGENE